MTSEQIHIGNMSHETAIGILKLMLEAMETYDGISPTPARINAFKMAIEALEQEPTNKNDLVTLTFSKGTLKYSCKDYVVYKKDWLRSHYGAEIDIMFGDSQYKEPTTKNDLGVDAISRADAIRVASGYCHPSNVAKELAKLPSVSPQEPRWIPVEERLPEVYEVVMTTRHGVVYPETRLTEDGWEWLYESGADYWEETDDIEAWMPLPEPYRAESEDQDGQTSN